MEELEFADIPNIHEILGEEKDCPNCIMPLAGLQYYSYDDSDELIGKVRPKSGDRLQLIREPMNAYDHNAIEVWFRDSRFMLGHIPREFAQFLAEDLDSGKNVRAYCVNSGNGGSWSVEILLFHVELHNQLQDLQVGMDLDSLTRYFDYLENKEPYIPIFSKERRKFIDEMHAQDRKKRRYQAADIFSELLIDKKDKEPPELPKQPPRSAKNRTYQYWDTIPENVGLYTKTEWGKRGFKLKKRLKKPFARVSYKAHGQTRKYDLYASSQVQSKKIKSDKQIKISLLNDLF